MNDQLASDRIHLTRNILKLCYTPFVGVFQCIKYDNLIEYQGKAASPANPFGIRLPLQVLTTRNPTLTFNS
jgi:hypothetical protein